MRWHRDSRTPRNRTPVPPGTTP
uniref:Uncharacterized protein n=1 Tax=Arundo donax TaxID=35708 RepID=A0A0A9FQ16_ARUDO